MGRWPRSGRRGDDKEGRRRKRLPPGWDYRLQWLRAGLDLAAPGPCRLAAAALDELLELLEVGLHLTVEHADRPAELLSHRLRLGLELELDLRAGVRDRLKRDRA